MAGTFEDGHTAYMRGDYERSIELLRGPAESGNPAAAYIVGRQYQLGQGVERDYARAWYWYRRAEAKGHVEAGLFRHLLVTKWKISKADLARARARYAALTAPKPKDADPVPVPASAPADGRKSNPQKADHQKADPETTASRADRPAPRRLGGRIALTPSMRPERAPAAVAAVSVKPRKTVRVTTLAPPAAPTRAVSRPTPASRRTPSRTTRDEPSETAVRDDPDCRWCDPIERGTPEAREEALDGRQAYDTAEEPGYDTAPDQPVWRPAPPARVIAPGYWRYRAWQRRQAWQRRARRGPPPGRGWRRGAWRRPGWHRD